MFSTWLAALGGRRGDLSSVHRAAREVAVVVDGRFAARTVAGLYNFQIAEATRDLTYSL